MIKLPVDNEDTSISIEFEDGQILEKVNIPSDPFPYNATMVSYWTDSGLVMEPMSRVSRVTIHVDAH